jgi:hypothetical protein
MRSQGVTVGPGKLVLDIFELGEFDPIYTNVESGFPGLPDTGVIKVARVAAPWDQVEHHIGPA